MLPKIGPSLDYLDWRHFAGAVADVFQSDAVHPWSRSADVWGLFSDARIELFHAVREAWVKRAEVADEYFPYSEDGVVRMYFKFRKRNADEIAAWRQEIDGMLV